MLSLIDRSPSPSVASTQVAAREILVDTSAPATTIQVRLHDGSRIKVALNLSHTVRDIRSHLEAYIAFFFPPRSCSVFDLLENHSLCKRHIPP